MGHKTSIFDLPEQKLKANTDEYKSAKKLTFCTKSAEDPSFSGHETLAPMMNVYSKGKVFTLPKQNY